MTQIILWWAVGGAIGYALLLSWIAWQWRSLVQHASQKPALRGAPFCSIIIAARNEARNIDSLLMSLFRQDYPADKYEIIIVNDHSTDRTWSCLQSYPDTRLHIYALSEEEHGKKAALSLGIQKSKGGILLTTDADCALPPRWLAEMATAVEHGADMVLAPVQLQGPNDWLTAFQALDVAGTMLLTGAAVKAGHPLLANGANLGFTQKLYLENNGYRNNADRASGDDVFLLQQAVKAQRKVTFLPSTTVIVQTLAMSSWQRFWQQRLRWATKTTAYTDYWLIGFQGLVYMISVGLLLSLACLPCYWCWVVFAWGIKVLADLLFLAYANREVGNPKYNIWLLLSSFLHTVYLVVLGTIALLPIKIYWKGRKTR